MIDKFRDQYRWLSNFHPVTIQVGEETYPSVEHAYMAAKCANPEDRKQFRNPTVTPGQAKRLGRGVKLRHDWESIKLDVMECLLRKKFLEPVLAQQLVGTGTAELIEGNTWGDRFWGVDGTGENHLGKLLMKIRDEHIKKPQENYNHAPKAGPNCFDIRLLDLFGSNGKTPSLPVVQVLGGRKRLLRRRFTGREEYGYPVFFAHEGRDTGTDPLARSPRMGVYKDVPGLGRHSEKRGNDRPCP